MSDASIQGVLKHWMKRGSTMPCASACDVLSGSNGIFEPFTTPYPNNLHFFHFFGKNHSSKIEVSATSNVGTPHKSQWKS